MATKKLSLLEYLTTESWLPFSEGISTLLVWGLIYIILLTLLSFAFSIPTGGPLDDHELSLIDMDLLALSADTDLIRSFAVVFQAGVFLPFLFDEYLISHIGEKRLADPSDVLTKLSFGAQTARFFRAVFYFAWERLAAKTYFSRRTMLRRHLFDSNRLKEKLLVQGGL